MWKRSNFRAMARPAQNLIYHTRRTRVCQVPIFNLGMIYSGVLSVLICMVLVTLSVGPSFSSSTWGRPPNCNNPGVAWADSCQCCSHFSSDHLSRTSIYACSTAALLDNEWISTSFNPFRSINRSADNDLAP
ncbi:hypothetical protein BDN70DRAFT_369837 [Pholiota conissans]|uniref:Uncharacterized protein n=1 Tax=Pholiota conissans TaxID=109636 RepID=A0A9P6D7R5_9AGAR|nr:hypothetical protein BDN70DRAFT_369837 [Pholiota conissans]